MARFDVHQPRAGALVIDVQCDALYATATRVIVPLLSQKAAWIRNDLTPFLDCHGESLILATNLLFSIPSRRLGPPVANLAQYRDEIVRALDVLFIGF